MGELVQKALLGFAAGVMIAASVWSLLIPAIENAEAQGVTGWIPASIGFLLGIGLLLAIDHFLPHQHLDDPQPEGMPCRMKKPTMLIFARWRCTTYRRAWRVGVVPCRIPYGRGLYRACRRDQPRCGQSPSQNVPEGAIISMPLVSCGLTRKKAFLYGVASGAVEPLGAALMVACIGFMTPALPYILAFAAGAMMYVVVEELIPETQTGKAHQRRRRGPGARFRAHDDPGCGAG